MKSLKYALCAALTAAALFLTACNVGIAPIQEDLVDNETDEFGEEDDQYSGYNGPTDYEGYQVEYQSIAKDEWQTHVYKTKEGVDYKIEHGVHSEVSVGSIGSSARISEDDQWSSDDYTIQGSDYNYVDMSSRDGDYIIVRVKGLGDAPVYWLRIIDANMPIYDMDKYHETLPDTLTTSEKEILTVVHDDGFRKIFKDAPYFGGTKTINGDSGSISISVQMPYESIFNVTFSNYTKNGITVNGSYSWWSKVDYTTVQNPSPEAGWFYKGNGSGSLSISGKHSSTIDVSFEFLNMDNQDNGEYHYNDYHVISYRFDGTEVNMVTKMLNGTFKKVWSLSWGDMVENFDGRTHPEQPGRDGGTVKWEVWYEGSYRQKRVEKITYNNYSAWGITVNGSINFYTYVDSNDNVLDNPDTADGRYDFQDTLQISGYRNGEADVHMNIIDYSGTWNFSKTFYVEGIGDQSVFIRLPAGFGR
jgi:hypothetical protein